MATWLLLCVIGGTVYQDLVAEKDCSPHGGWEAKREEQTRVPKSPSKALPPITKVPPTRPHLFFYHLPVVPWDGDQTFKMCAFGGL
jgi:hypothetical protein